MRPKAPTAYRLAQPSVTERLLPYPYTRTVHHEIRDQHRGAGASSGDKPDAPADAAALSDLKSQLDSLQKRIDSLSQPKGEKAK